jgi:hypothetical protein
VFCRTNTVKTLYDFTAFGFIIDLIIYSHRTHTFMAAPIDPVLAKTLVKMYQKQNSSPGGPALMTPDKQFLNGYYIDRECLDEILSNPDFVGLSVYLAKHPDYTDSSENIFTIVCAGAEPNPQYSETSNGSPYINTGEMYEYVDPCPAKCGSIGN